MVNRSSARTTASVFGNESVIDGKDATIKIPALACKRRKRIRHSVSSMLDRNVTQASIDSLLSMRIKFSKLTVFAGCLLARVVVHLGLLGGKVVLGGAVFYPFGNVGGHVAAAFVYAAALVDAEAEAGVLDGESSVAFFVGTVEPFA